jgi:hypothetical protein
MFLRKEVIMSQNESHRGVLFEMPKVGNETTEQQCRRLLNNVDLKDYYNTYKEMLDCETDFIIFNDIVYDYKSEELDPYECFVATKNNDGTINFIVNYYNWEYAPYKFKTRGERFWKKQFNVDMTLKYLIEKDMKLPIEKIPLYITRNNLHIKCHQLYNALLERRFDDNLYDWINRLYPNKFIEDDFNVGVIRNEFDSLEEKLVDELLRKQFKSVIYNNRKSKNKITVLGMNPDWFIFTDQNVYIVEYFGIAIDHQKYNKRISDYVDKTKEKIDKYSRLPYGEKIYLYPDDIREDHIGFNEKVSKIV